MFKPKRVIFEKGVLDTEAGRDIYNKVKDSKNIEIIIESPINQIKKHIPGENLYSQYREGKKTMVVGLKKSLKFQTCKPSAHYQLPLVSGCMGQCEYCYLNTQLGDKPFVRVFANIDDILQQAKKYIEERKPEITIFEGAATSDPIPVELYTNSLRKSIEFFGEDEYARFRFVTKYSDIDSLIDAKHNGHTEIRFSLNTQKVIDTYEHYTASANKRIEAAIKLAKSGYKVGFLIAPVFLYDNWEEDYKDLLISIRNKLPKDFNSNITFEIITHRYTTKAKNRILEIFPDTTLPMNDEVRKFKFGQFGYGKYVYTKEDLSQVKDFFKKSIDDIFPENTIMYII
ncbi:spore photoproduct lyase [Paraclostridium bifermentans]|uniref:spore photoproduct lyase n=1 Tax=Paraclostridium bifermentans TaxID=1490 RepID=UPI00359C4213